MPQVYSSHLPAGASSQAESWEPPKTRRSLMGRMGHETRKCVAMKGLGIKSTVGYHDKLYGSPKSHSGGPTKKVFTKITGPGIFQYGPREIIGFPDIMRTLIRYPRCRKAPNEVSISSNPPPPKSLWKESTDAPTRSQSDVLYHNMVTDFTPICKPFKLATPPCMQKIGNTDKPPFEARRRATDPKQTTAQQKPKTRSPMHSSPSTYTQGRAILWFRV